MSSLFSRRPKKEYPESKLHAPIRYDQAVGAQKVNQIYLTDDKSREDERLAKAQSAFPHDEAELATARSRQQAANKYLDGFPARRKNGMIPQRTELGIRKDEEANYLSWAREKGSEGTVSLPQDMCEKIAGLNNKTAAWDEDLRATRFKGGKNAGKLDNMDRKEAARRQRQGQKDSRGRR